MSVNLDYPFFRPQESNLHAKGLRAMAIKYLSTLTYIITRPSVIPFPLCTKPPAQINTYNAMIYLACYISEIVRANFLADTENIPGKGKDKKSSIDLDYSYRATNPFNGIHSIGARINL